MAWLHQLASGPTSVGSRVGLGWAWLGLASCFSFKAVLDCGMADSAARKVANWIRAYLLWDTAGRDPSGFLGALWATRKMLIALAATALLTWREWVEHHPPEIVIVAFLHFAFVFAAIGLAVYALQRFGRKIGSR